MDVFVVGLGLTLMLTAFFAGLQNVLRSVRDDEKRSGLMLACLALFFSGTVTTVHGVVAVLEQILFRVF